MFCGGWFFLVVEGWFGWCYMECFLVEVVEHHGEQLGFVFVFSEAFDEGQEALEAFCSAGVAGAKACFEDCGDALLDDVVDLLRLGDFAF